MTGRDLAASPGGEQDAQCGPLERLVRSGAIGPQTGTNLMAAAAAHGLIHITDSDDGSPRGFFCGMGVCGECTVSLPDGSRVRACMTSYGSDVPVAGRGEPETVDEPDLLVIGGGPAGLAAARAAALHGLRVVLLDEREKPGGQYYKQSGDAAASNRADKQMASGRRLIAEVIALGVEVVTKAVVWGAFRPLDFAVLVAGRAVRFRPRRVILATGAFERGVPLPGWTYPGVMTTGAAQTMLRAHGVVPGRRVLIAGNGPLNFQLANELLNWGAKVVAVAEAASAPGWASLRSLAGLMNAPGLLAQGARFMASMRQNGVELHYGTVLSAVEGDGRAQHARLTRLDNQGRPRPDETSAFEVDLVCMGYGLEPANELARMLGCRLRHDETRGTFAVVTDEDGTTSVPGVLVAGDGGGIVGAHAALAQGWLAGCRAAVDLGRKATTAIETETRRQSARLVRHRRFQSALWTLFRAPQIQHELAAPDTPICRCENVSLATIQAELASGAATIGALKRGTRAGMGRCQGRYCGPVLRTLLTGRDDAAPTEVLAFAPRPPVRPVPISALAQSAEH